MAKNSLKAAIHKTLPRMWLYIHTRTDLVKSDGTPVDVCMGEHFGTYESAIERVRGQKAKEKYAFDRGDVRYHIFPVGELAVRVGLNYEHAHMDDWVRHNIPELRATTVVNKKNNKKSEYHEGISFDEVKALILAFLKKMEQPLPLLSLSQWQGYQIHTLMENIKARLASGKKLKSRHYRVLAHLCARFGKTFFVGALMLELDFKVMVMATYVKTSFKSFLDDYSEVFGFDQFKNFDPINSEDPEYQQKIDSSLKNGRRVIVLLSLCPGSNRQGRMEFLYSLPTKIFTVIDEADFGAHKEGQALPLRTAMESHSKYDDLFVAMTGTGADKLSKFFEFDDMIVTNYEELVHERRLTEEGNPTIVKGWKSKHFKIDYQRSLKVVRNIFAQVSWQEAYDKALAIDPTLSLEDETGYPSFRKAEIDPAYAKHLWYSIIDGLHGSSADMPSLNIDWQLSRLPRDIQKLIRNPKDDMIVKIVWLGGAIPNRSMNKIKEYHQNVLGTSVVVHALVGSTEEERGTTNAQVQSDAENVIMKAKRDGKKMVILIGARLGTRSFSIPEISEVYFLYDKGSEGTTAQRQARGNSPYKNDKICFNVSLSFDPNRDDKFDGLVINAAKNIKNKTGGDFTEILPEVYKTMTFMRLTAGGPVKVSFEDWSSQAGERGSYDRILANEEMQNLQFSDEEITALLASTLKMTKAEKKAAAKMGKTKMNTLKKAERVTHKKTAAQEIRAKIAALVEASERYILGANTKSLKAAMNTYRTNPILKKDLENSFGMPAKIINSIYEKISKHEIYSVKLVALGLTN